MSANRRLLIAKQLRFLHRAKKSSKNNRVVAVNSDTSKLEIEPAPGEGFVFEDKITGGAIPRQFIKPVSEGIQDAMQRGYLAGYELVDIKARLVFGSYHEVDSDERSFHIAGSLAFQDAVKKAKPVLLEPIMKIEVVTPEEYMGAVNGDLNRRRGQIEKMEPRPGNVQVVTAFVPLSEMFGYTTDLRSSTQGRATSSMHFERYDKHRAMSPKKLLPKLKAQQLKEFLIDKRIKRL